SGPTADRRADGLCDSESPPVPAFRDRPDRDSHRRQPLGGEGSRGGRNDWRYSGDCQRGDRRARAVRGDSHRHAVAAGENLAADGKGGKVMIPSAFDYAAPQTLEEALSLLQTGGVGTKALSGGQSLLPVLKLRLAAPEQLVDLAAIPGLRRIEAQQDPISIGAMATHAMIEDSAALRAACPLLPEVASCIGDRQVRNRGTIGGSLANADPAADWPAAVLALDAELVAAGPRGTVKSIPARDFFFGMMQTA